MPDSGSSPGCPAEAPTPPGGKLVVAVHGIGEQFQYSTIQSVAYSFCRYCGAPAGIPLGAFRSEGARGGLRLEDPTYPRELYQDLKDIRFAEVYWANIPRTPIKDGYILEEPRMWARTVVGRIQAVHRQQADARAHLALPWAQHLDYRLIECALTEMVDAMNVLGRLMFLAEKAGWFKFELREILLNYLGDVQVVADFEEYRNDILNVFDKVMRGCAAQQAPDEIYIVAHSEGTVVALMGLLRAMTPPAGAPAGDAGPEWIKKVRGFMTIGSPIDKHLILWPEIWRPYELAAVGDPERGEQFVRRGRPLAPIRWKNYYDYGDPVGFDLEYSRAWMTQHKWDEGFFAFEGAARAQDGVGDDYGFTRYFFPGKAHIDYWADDHVFGHFIQNVVNVPPRRKRFDRPPATTPVAKVTSYFLPYAVVAGLLFTASFLVCKAILSSVSPAPVDVTYMSGWTTALAAIMLGLTAANRSYYLTRSGRWRWIGFVTIAVALALSTVSVRLGVGDWSRGLAIRAAEAAVAALLLLLGGYLGRSSPCGQVSPWRVALQFLFGAASAALALVSLGGLWNASDKTAAFPFHDADALFCIQTAALVTFLAGWWLNCFRPELKAKTLIIPGTVAVTGVAAVLLGRAAAGRGPNIAVWPAVIGGLALVYIWWLAALVFDLTFMWHRYIRESIVNECLREHCGRPDLRDIARKRRSHDASGRRESPPPGHTSQPSGRGKQRRSLRSRWS